MRRLKVGQTALRILVLMFLVVGLSLHAQQAPFDPGPTVNCNAPEGDLQKTIDNASAGSTIYVRGFCTRGPYFINKNLRLAPFDGNEPRGISAVPGSNHVLHIRDASVEINSLPFDAANAAHGIYVDHGSLRANSVEVANASQGMGILLQGSTLAAFDVTVRNSAQSGIHVGLTSTATINNSRLTNNDVGVFITEASSAIMGANVIETSRAVGVFVIAASSVFIVDTDMINGNGVGLLVDRLSNASLFESRIEGNAGPGVYVSPWYSFLSLRTPVNTIQNNNPDVNCNDRAILDLHAPQNSSTKTSFIAAGCIVVNGPIFTP